MRRRFRSGLVTALGSAIGRAVVAMACSLLPTGFVIDPSPGQSKLDDRYGNDAEKNNPGDRGRIPHMKIFKRLFEEVHHHKKGRVAGATILVVHDITLSEDLERIDERDGCDEEEHTRKHRQGDIFE